MTTYQEKFWQGKFGTKYSLRHLNYKKLLKNIINKKIKSNLFLKWEQMLVIT